MFDKAVPHPQDFLFYWSNAASRIARGIPLCSVSFFVKLLHEAAALTTQLTHAT